MRRASPLCSAGRRAQVAAPAVADGVTRSISSAGTAQFQAGAPGLRGLQQPELAPGGEEAEGAAEPFGGTIVNRRESRGHGRGGSGRGKARARANPELLASFDGLNHFDQRFTNGGNQFSLEPPDQGLCVGTSIRSSPTASTARRCTRSPSGRWPPASTSPGSRRSTPPAPTAATPGSRCGRPSRPPAVRHGRGRHGVLRDLHAAEQANGTGTSTDLLSRALTNTRSLDSATPSVTLDHVVPTVGRHGTPPRADQKAGEIPLGQCINDTARGPFGSGLGCWRLLNIPEPAHDEVESPLDANDTRMQQVVFANGRL